MLELDGRRLARTAGQTVRRLLRAALWLGAAAMPVLVVATLYEAAVAQAPTVDPSLVYEVIEDGLDVEVSACGLDQEAPLPLDLMALDPGPPVRLPGGQRSGPITDAEIGDAIAGIGW